MLLCRPLSGHYCGVFEYLKATSTKEVTLQGSRTTDFSSLNPSGFILMICNLTRETLLLACLVTEEGLHYLLFYFLDP